jgi:nucleotide-binding universal stress UspA family protein
VKGSIVCGVDGSDNARAALAEAAALAEQLDAPLVAVHVVHGNIPTSAFGSVAGPVHVAEFDQQLEAGRLLLDHLLEDAGLGHVDRRVAYGFPADRLADLAEELEARLIVVGSRGRGAFKAAFLGSVSGELIGVARSPVLIVPPGAVEAQEAERRAAAAGR